MAEGKNRVTVFVPRGASNEDPNVFVSVNGINYLLPKGTESSVPRAVAWELERSRKAQEMLDRRREQMRSDGM